MERHTLFPLRRLLGILAVIVIVGLALWYVLFQARLLIIGPEITLTNVPTTLQTTPLITLTGTARNISYLTLNGRVIFTDPDGNFEEALMLENGYTVTTLEAADRYGRTSSLTRSFVYVPASLVTTE